MVAGYEICRMVDIDGELQPASGPAHMNPAAIFDGLKALRAAEPGVERRPYFFRWQNGAKQREPISDDDLEQLSWAAKRSMGEDPEADLSAVW
jgi:hypothetical protein